MHIDTIWGHMNSELAILDKNILFTDINYAYIGINLQIYPQSVQKQ